MLADLIRFIFRPIFEALARIEFKLDWLSGFDVKTLTRIEAKIDRLAPSPKPDTLTIAFGPVSSKVAPKGEPTMQVLTDEQKCTATLIPKTAAGNPAKVDGVPAWSVSDPTILGMVVADDGMSAVLTALGPLGSSQVSVIADADLGDGVRQITTVDEVQVVAAEATTLGITFGTPEPK